MAYFFTSESVSEGHPDKVADQISDAILDAMLTQDPNSRVACETLVTTGLVTLAGELNTHAKVDFQQIARDTITKIGYTKDEYKFSANSCAVVSALHTQSPDIAQGVDEGEDKEQGAGDQGMMFGYATDESDSYMPLTLVISHLLMSELARIRREGRVMEYLRPDAKSQVTIEYDDDHHPIRITTIVVSTQHDEMIKSDNKKDADTQMQNQIKEDVIKYLIPAVKSKLSQRVQKLFDDKIKYYVNPTGLFIIGGPHGDAGLTGRKIIVDTYGGRGAHGGGAFSGKDPSKVDRSAAYAARHIAKNLVAAGVAEQALVQLSYAIGIAEPISINVNTFGTAKVNLTDSQISDKIIQEFNSEFKPKSIIERLKLKNPIYSETAAYGHMGRESYTKDVRVAYQIIEEKSNQKTTVQKFETKQIEFFTWEKLDYVDRIKNLFNL
ncbi:MAG: methionine adenosyltransferase [Chitinophagales bacterium]|nr:methionine adenosyltransferase [Chitinophagales bacterium]